MIGDGAMRDVRAVLVSEALGIRYTHALRYVRAVGVEYDDDIELIHACRALKEEAENRIAKRGVLPASVGKVRCTSCGATAEADGKGTPIPLPCKKDCPDRAKSKEESCDGCRLIARKLEGIDPRDEDGAYEIKRLSREHRKECPNRVEG